MAAITELGYARFGVSDLAAWREFASNGIGLEVHPESTDDALYLRLDQWHHRVILEQGDADDLTGIGFRVAGAEEFREMQATLADNGINAEVASKEDARANHVLEMMRLTDPAGNPIEIFHGPRIDTHLPFHPGRGMYGRFVTGDGGMGHMVVSHNNLDETWAFYNLLGMRGGIEYQVPLPGGETMEMLFMDCNERDHSVAFGMPSKTRINHVMFEVDNYDDVMFTYERLRKDHHIAILPGKHANDHMFSFYCQSPSGFNVEVGCGARPATFQSEYYVRDSYGHQHNPGGK